MPENTGTLIIDRTNDNPGAVARAHLYGPRGGIIGDALIDQHDAEQAIVRLMAFGVKPCFLEALLNAAEAVLDSEGGVASLGELAEALYACDAKRDYRAEFPNVAASTETEV